MILRWVVGMLLIVTSVACAGQTAAQSGPQRCSSKDWAAVKNMADPAQNKFADAAKVADSTSRIGLAPAILEMQDDRRAYAALNTPKCYQPVQVLVLKGMDDSIQAILDFAAQKTDSTVQAASKLAADDFQQAIVASQAAQPK